MKVGDMVTHTHLPGGTSWRVVEIKTDSRAYWIRLDEAWNGGTCLSLGDGVWRDARYFKVMEKQK